MLDVGLWDIAIKRWSVDGDRFFDGIEATLLDIALVDPLAPVAQAILPARENREVLRMLSNGALRPECCADVPPILRLGCDSTRPERRLMSEKGEGHGRVQAILRDDVITLLGDG